MNRNNFPIWDAWQAEVDGAQDKPWLAGLLFKRRQRLFGRFAEVYRQLCALPRRVRRGLQRRTAMTLAGVALMMVLGRAPTSHASTAIIVDPGAKGLNPDGQCSLVEAMLNASFDTAFSPDCSVGSGADTITLAGNTYSYAYANGFNSALPHIQNDPLTIEANGAVFERAAGSSANFNVFTLSNDATLTLNEATITGGANNDSGGGIRVNTGSALILNNSTVSNNETMQQGGGIYIASGSTGLITNSTISGNRANFGAGILSLGGDMTIVTSTISGNTAIGSGGGLVGFNNVTVIRRSIVSGNIAPVGSETYLIGSTTTSDQNLFGHSGLTSATAFQATAPVTAGDINAASDGTAPTVLASILDTALADNGGKTQTHALVANSPAIDVVGLPPVADGRVPAAMCTAGELDQRGLPRANGSGQGGNACDLGSMEGDSAEPTAITLHHAQATASTSWWGLALGGLLTGFSAYLHERGRR